MNKFNNIAVLFDLDGVLIDSEGRYSEFWTEMGRRHPSGYQPHELALKVKGRNLDNILSTFFPDPDVQADIKRILVDFQKSLTFNFFPGAIEFLDSLKQAGIPCCLATSSEDEKMANLYAQHPGFDKYFAAIVTGDMVTNSKPNPECYLTAARLAGCPIEQCFVIEDSLQGLDAGMASGATVIGLSTTYPTEAIQGKAHLILPSIEHLSIERMMAAKQR